MFLFLQSNFIEITRRPGCSPVNLLHILRISFPKNTSEGLLYKLENGFQLIVRADAAKFMSVELVLLRAIE